MALQTIPDVATAYMGRSEQRRKALVQRLRVAWGRMGDDFSASFIDIAPQMLATTNAAQEAAVEDALDYIPAVLADTGQRNITRPVAQPSPVTFVGTAGDGRPTETLLYGAVTHAKDAVATGATTTTALDAGWKYLELAAATMLSDTARAAETLASGIRPVTGFVRMLVPPSCGRCVVLAGKHYKRNQGFLRHPRCDCRHIPASEALAGDMTTDPRAFLDGLTPDELRKALGSEANAKAYSEFGADPFQIINSYRARPIIEAGKPLRYSGSLRTAQIYGRDVKYSTEAMTKRGLAYKQMQTVRALSREPSAARGEKARVVIAPRLMPESIFQIAGSNQQRALQMLREHGWILAR